MKRLLLLALFPITVQAQTIGIDLASIHIPSRSGQSDINPGIYIIDQNGLSAGAYRNSLGRASAWAGLTIEQGPWAITGGILYGYQRRAVNCRRVIYPGAVYGQVCDETEGSKGPFMPLLAPSVRLPEIFGVTPRLTLLPPWGAGGSTVIHLSIERQL